MNVSTKIYEKRGLLSIAEALALMISFGSFIATLIFGILEAVKEDNKKITVNFSEHGYFL